MTKKRRPRRGGGGGEGHRGDAPVCDDNQVYARVIRMLGNGRLVAKCSDGQERQCRIRGNMRRREWVRAGDTVLVALRPFEDDKADVIHRYEPADVAKLDRQGEPIRVGDDEHETDDVVVFADDEDIDWERV